MSHDYDSAGHSQIEHHWLSVYELEETPGDSEEGEARHATVHGVSKNWT